MKNKISIIIPIYKVENYLNNCIESIVNQTYKNLEIILVDDGSPDLCPKICDDWAQKDDRIIVIHKENGGLSDARNMGIDKSTGDYLMFVDSDDYVDNTICEKLYNLLTKNDCDISMCGVQKVYYNEKVNTMLVEEEIVILNKSETLDSLINSKIDYLMTAWAKLYKREIFKDIRYPKGRLHEDEYVIHRILHLSERSVITNAPLYFYMQRTNSITTTQNEKNIIDKTEAYEDRFEFLNKYYTVEKTANSNAYLNYLKTTYCLTHQKELKKFLLKKYKIAYKSLKKHQFKDKLFYHFTYLYLILFKINYKRKINENRNEN